VAKPKRRTNNHHLIWPRSQQIGIRKEARQLPCLQIALDIEVHRVLHRIYGTPKPLPVEDAKWLIERHRSKTCACYSADARDHANILAISFREGDDDDERSETG
jgi:hypothetical protein